MYKHVCMKKYNLCKYIDIDNCDLTEIDMHDLNSNTFSILRCKP